MNTDVTMHLSEEDKVTTEAVAGPLGDTRWIDILVNGEDALTIFYGRLTPRNARRLTRALRGAATAIDGWNEGREG